LLNRINITTPPKLRIKRIMCPRREAYKAIVEIISGPNVLSRHKGLAFRTTYQDAVADATWQANGFQAVGMLIVQPQSQAPKVLKHFILALQEENTSVTRIVINDDKNVPPASHGENPRRINSVHMEELSRVLNHHGINERMGSCDHLAMTTRCTNQITLKLEQGQSSEWA
jgi:hypothetical protein